MKEQLEDLEQLQQLKDGVVTTLWQVCKCRNLFLPWAFLFLVKKNIFLTWKKIVTAGVFPWSHECIFIVGEYLTTSAVYLNYSFTTLSLSHKVKLVLQTLDSRRITVHFVKYTSYHTALLYDALCMVRHVQCRMRHVVYAPTCTEQCEHAH
jgi:hypothetical protein